jgi:sensor histidine kinase YesM
MKRKHKDEVDLLTKNHTSQIEAYAKTSNTKITQLEHENAYLRKYVAAVTIRKADRLKHKLERANVVI